MLGISGILILFVFQTVHDKIDSVTGLEEHIIKETKARISAEENTFKQKISEISSDVTASPIDIRRGVYRIQSELVFCVDQWNKYLAVIKRNPKPSPASTTPVSASPKPINASTELISGTSETGTSSPRSPPEDQDPLKKGHRRVRSDGSLTGMRHNVTRSLSEHARQGLHRSMDDILSTRTSTKDSESKSSHSKSSDLKHAESRYSKLTSSTKKFLKSLTESAYKKIEVKLNLLNLDIYLILSKKRPTFFSGRIPPIFLNLSYFSARFHWKSTTVSQAVPARQCWSMRSTSRLSTRTRSPPTSTAPNSSSSNLQIPPQATPHSASNTSTLDPWCTKWRIRAG